MLTYHRPVKIESHITVESAEQNALDLLQAAAGLPRQRIKFAMTLGAVWLTRGRHTQRLRRAKRALHEGDELHLYYDEAILAETPSPPTLIADVGEYSVWNKPRGLRSQGSKWGDHCTLLRWAERHLEPERSGFTVHRLDRAASGVMLVAHSKKTAAALSGIFRSRKVEKRYSVTVHGFRLIGVNADKTQSFLEARIETGRKHQIRRHLAELGHPVVGDRLYGSGEQDGVDLELTAILLAFRCPVSGEKVEYRAD